VHRAITFHLAYRWWWCPLSARCLLKLKTSDADKKHYRSTSTFDFMKFHIQPKASELETVGKVIA
jgi:hypothetical protein